MRSLDDAQRILEDMLQEICNTLFVSEAAAFVTGDAADTTQVCGRDAARASLP